MTCREKLALEYPDCIRPDLDGGCEGCPEHYEYLLNPKYCFGSGNDSRCTKCWDREIPETSEEQRLKVKTEE